MMVNVTFQCDGKMSTTKLKKSLKLLNFYSIYSHSLFRFLPLVFFTSDYRPLLAAV